MKKFEYILENQVGIKTKLIEKKKQLTGLIYQEIANVKNIIEGNTGGQ